MARFTIKPCKVIRVSFFGTMYTCGAEGLHQPDSSLHEKAAEVLLDWWDSKHQEFHRRTIFVSRGRGRQFEQQRLAQSGAR